MSCNFVSVCSFDIKTTVCVYVGFVFAYYYPVIVLFVYSSILTGWLFVWLFSMAVKHANYFISQS